MRQRVEMNFFLRAPAFAVAPSPCRPQGPLTIELFVNRGGSREGIVFRYVLGIRRGTSSELDSGWTIEDWVL